MADLEQSTNSSPDQSQYHVEYELLRKAGPFEVLTHVFHELGIQNNILVSAKYKYEFKSAKNDSDSGQVRKLTTAAVYRALAKVIDEHPALSVIGVNQPSEKKAGCHRLWEARTPRINLDDVVEFMDLVDGDDDVTLAKVYEDQHNMKFETHDLTKPWWRIVVVNAETVVFVYHHSIGDGMSGFAFHRSLRAALDADSSFGTVEEEEEQNAPSVIESSKRSLPPCPLYEIEDKLSWPLIIYNFLFWNLIRFFIREKYFLFSDATYSKLYPTIAIPKPLPSANSDNVAISERAVTKVQILRIKKDVMEKCLKACREHGTSFTALLHTLVLVTLASDIYPNAKVGFSKVAVNIRPLLSEDPGEDSFTNAASQYDRVQFLGRYREAGRDGQRLSSVHEDLIWKLAREYKQGLRKSMEKGGSVLQSFLTGKLLGEDVEEVGKLYGLGLYSNNSFLISNLGVFRLKPKVCERGGTSAEHDGDGDGGNSRGTGEWEIVDVAFSAGSVTAAVGDAGIVLNVASLEGSDCVVCGTWEEGVLGGDVVGRVLKRLVWRLKGVL